SSRSRRARRFSTPWSSPRSAPSASSSDAHRANLRHARSASTRGAALPARRGAHHPRRRHRRSADPRRAAQDRAAHRRARQQRSGPLGARCSRARRAEDRALGDLRVARSRRARPRPRGQVPRDRCRPFSQAEDRGAGRRALCQPGECRPAAFHAADRRGRAEDLRRAGARAYPRARLKLPPLFRNRDYMLLWGGQVVSTLGSSASNVIYPLLILAITDSPAAAGIGAALAHVPYLLFSLPAGALIDRWDRKRVMILCDAGRALTVASIAAALWLDVLSVRQLYAAAFIEGSFFVFFNIAEVAALPRVVPKDQLPQAAAQNEAACAA